MTSAALALDPPRTRELAREHGWNATSFQTLGVGFLYFFHGDGYVAYVDTGAAWVAAGAPVCRSERLGSTTGAFIQAARAAGRRSCFFGVEPRLLGAAEGTLWSVQIGEQPVWDPRDWAETLGKQGGLREQLRRARAKGVVVRPVMHGEFDELEKPLRQLTERWLRTRAMPPLGFLVAVSSAFDEARGPRFVASLDDRPVGLTCLLPVPGRQGWFVEHLLRDPDAPNGTVELMVDAAMRWAASMGSPWLTLGLAPLAGDVPEPLRLLRRHLGWLYDFEGLRAFKAKLRPESWIPIYLAHPPAQSALVSIIDVLAAFAPGGLLRFGVRTVVRWSGIQ